jgi:hypothetical protein
MNYDSNGGRVISGRKKGKTCTKKSQIKKLKKIAWRRQPQRTHTYTHTKGSQTTRSKKKVVVLSIGTNEEQAIIVGVCVTQVCWRFVWPKIGIVGWLLAFSLLGLGCFVLLLFIASFLAFSILQFPGCIGTPPLPFLLLTPTTQNVFQRHTWYLRCIQVGYNPTTNQQENIEEANKLSFD